LLSSSCSRRCFAYFCYVLFSSRYVPGCKTTLFSGFRLLRFVTENHFHCWLLSLSTFVVYC
jgi:hypothetical protein